MFRDIVYFLASLFIFGLVYVILNIIITLLSAVFTIDDAIVVAVYFIWSLVPIIYYIGKAKEFFESRGIIGGGDTYKGQGGEY